MIRDATPTDIPELLRMGRAFAAKLRLGETVGYDEATMERLFAHLIDSPTGILLVTDGGAAGGMIYPAMFNAQHTTGQELFWWVDPGKRGKGIALLVALEAKARELGADSWMMSTVEALNFEAASKLYERRGYRASDRNFLKVFGA
ncbi:MULTISPECIES: GNAT family N-acetyltransferase [unclassified Sphingomonas]|uniref:GNAT family N-acetyltransferase n=1 Tax=unclassified Sphingomonas TaxID=196159 RepID=UPI0006FD15AE|nr:MULTISPECIES: GNAT family N-acetyltransferase [unclassified Sphingomonas]KQM58793.1 hypothetical protein ASE65_10540 [Sphingomonas sp. Leaf16]KQN11048.1 hypothetical protein ASE81_11525 [Sphingomonas sp. Leaf29]KQN18349.1 hypothetical protein ASE83_11460 [Sphingomonas sp. Leaf32]